MRAILLSNWFVPTIRSDSTSAGRRFIIEPPVSGFQRNHSENTAERSIPGGVRSGARHGRVFAQMPGDT
jgi:hypothetical protein